MKKQRRRRRKNKTDYKKRIALLKSESPRIVFRRTNKHIIAQYIKSKEAQDSIEYGVSSKSLTDYGWPKELEGSLKSMPASYLTGFLFGKKVSHKQKGKDQNPIIDIGLARKIHKNRFFAFLKGLKDAGINIECKEEFFPEEDKIKGKHLKKDFSDNFEKIKSNIEKK
jgi:large subunit ribosomal protein L18